jgi:DNA-binding response OmpR family regulator
MPDRRITILLVDSDCGHRAALARTLRGGGYRVLEGNGYQDAENLYQLHAGEIDLLLTAISLPGRNGYELADQLRAAEQGLKVLFVSGMTGAVLRRFYGREPDDKNTLFRPFEPGDFLQRVKALLARKVGDCTCGST